MKRNRKRNSREQLAFEFEEILKALEDAFILKLNKYWNNLTKKVLKQSNNLSTFKKSLNSINTSDITELRRYLNKYHKLIGNTSIQQLNKEIKELTGRRSNIRIPNIHEGLRYRAELLAKDQVREFTKHLKDRVSALSGTKVEKAKLWRNIKKASKQYQNRHITITSRMESVTAANAQRLLAGQKSKIVQGWQFMAVIDSRTTQICSQRHLKILKKDSPLLKYYMPPLHWGCRSLLSPVTIYEKNIKFTSISELSAVPPRDFGKKWNKKYSLFDSDRKNLPDKTLFSNYSKLNKPDYKPNNPDNKRLTGKERLKFIGLEALDILRVTKNKHERGVILDRFGNVIYEKNGTINRVTFEITRNIAEQMKTYIHNHPSSFPHSAKDMFSLVKTINTKGVSFNYQEVVVAVDKHPYYKFTSEHRLFRNITKAAVVMLLQSSTKILKFNDLNLIKLKVSKEYSKILDDLIKNKSSIFSTYTEKEITQLINTLVWYNLSKKYDFKFILRNIEDE